MRWRSLVEKQCFHHPSPLHLQCDRSHGAETLAPSAADSAACRVVGVLLRWHQPPVPTILGPWLLTWPLTCVPANGMSRPPHRTAHRWHSTRCLLTGQPNNGGHWVMKVVGVGAGSLDHCLEHSLLPVRIPCFRLYLSEKGTAFVVFVPFIHLGFMTLASPSNSFHKCGV